MSILFREVGSMAVSSFQFFQETAPSTGFITLPTCSGALHRHKGLVQLYLRFHSLQFFSLFRSSCFRNVDSIESINCFSFIPCYLSSIAAAFSIGGAERKGLVIPSKTMCPECHSACICTILYLEEKSWNAPSQRHTPFIHPIAACSFNADTGQNV